MTWEKDEAGKILHSNHREVFGIDFAGRTIAEVYPPEIATECRDFERAAQNSERPVARFFYIHNVHWAAVQWKNERGGLTGFAVPLS